MWNRTGLSSILRLLPSNHRSFLFPIPRGTLPSFIRNHNFNHSKPPTHFVSSPFFSTSNSSTSQPPTPTPDVDSNTQSSSVLANPEETIDALRDEASKALEQEDFHQAVDLFTRLLHRIESDSTIHFSNENLSALYIRLAFSLHCTSKYAEALHHYKLALSLIAGVTHPNHPALIEPLINTAETLAALGQFEAAEESAGEALRLIHLTRGQRRTTDERMELYSQEIAAESNLASYLVALHRLPEAEKSSTSAMNHARKIFGEEHPSLVQIRYQLNTIKGLIEKERPLDLEEEDNEVIDIRDSESESDYDLSDSDIEDSDDDEDAPIKPMKTGNKALDEILAKVAEERNKKRHQDSEESEEDPDEWKDTDDEEDSLDDDDDDNIGSTPDIKQDQIIDDDGKPQPKFVEYDPEELMKEEEKEREKLIKELEEGKNGSELDSDEEESGSELESDEEEETDEVRRKRKKEMRYEELHADFMEELLSYNRQKKMMAERDRILKEAKKQQQDNWKEKKAAARQEEKGKEANKRGSDTEL